MKQVIAVVLHQVGRAFHVEVRERPSGFYGKWFCQICGAAGASAHDFHDADEAFESVKDVIALHNCEARSSSIN